MKKEFVMFGMQTDMTEFATKIANAMLSYRYVNICETYDRALDATVGYINISDKMLHLNLSHVPWHHFRNPLTREELLEAVTMAKKILKEKGLYHQCRINDAGFIRQ